MTSITKDITSPILLSLILFFFLEYSSIISMAVPGKEARPLDISILQVVEETPEAECTTHQAACHCGAVQFSVTLKWPFPKYPVNTCSCTICTQNGHLFVYPCRRDVVFSKGKLISSSLLAITKLQILIVWYVSLGYDNLSSYVFHTKTKSHKFCKTCGSSILADFEVFKQGQTVEPARDILAVNVSCFFSVLARLLWL